MISKFILTLTIIGLATANLHLNVKYRNILEGPQALDERIAQEIYMHFKSPHFERSEYRFRIFFETLKEINRKRNILLQSNESVQKMFNLRELNEQAILNLPAIINHFWLFFYWKCHFKRLSFTSSRLYSRNDTTFPRITIQNS